jgi:glycerophosphoryl diester phosphodiesterase
MRPLVVGHRGASAYVLENTRESFLQAFQMGADMVELDVHESLDRQFVVIHDRDLRRVSGKKDLIQQTHSQILRSTELRNKKKLLFLHEVFQLLPVTLGIIIELKSIRSFKQMGDFVAARMKERRVILASFDLSLIRRVQEYSPGLPFGVVSRTLTNIGKASHMGINFENVFLDFQALNPKTIHELSLHHLRIFAWTVDRTEDIRRMIDLGVDGIISNRPDVVRRILGELT